VDYQAAARFRDQHVRAAFDRFQSRKKGWDRFQSFRAGNAAWLPDFSLYTALKRAHGGVQWTLWPTPLRARRPKALAEARRQLADELQFHAFEQWQFARQWDALRKYAESRGVALIGDLPIFVAHDSADVWAHPELFQLDAEGMPTVVSGVPPDYFSATGQRWGNPLYRWPLLKRRGYAWWIERMQKALERFSAVRLDHFIGFQRYWEIPAACPTAEDGKWMPGPGDSLFQALRRALGPLPLIAEDLGAITPAVKALRDRFELPGIRILQFAFGTDPSAPDFKPHNYPRRAVVYTGTHDNDTTVSWFEQRNHDERNQALAYLGARGDEIHWDLIRAALSSVADLAVVPMQDLLGLGAEARMNLPGTAVGNWAWRVSKRALSPALADRLGAMTRMYDR
jgi:4-alpha-glucanotransferase